jgi:hypothetical protein
MPNNDPLTPTVDEGVDAPYDEQPQIDMSTLSDEDKAKLEAIQKTLDSVGPVLDKLVHGGEMSRTVNLRPNECRVLVDWFTHIQNIADIQQAELMKASAVLQQQAETIRKFEADGQKLWRPGPPTSPR